MANRMQLEAHNAYHAGPAPLTKDYDLLDDFRDCTNDEEAIMTFHELVIQVVDFVLRANGQWSGRGKTLTRALYRYDKILAHRLFECLSRYHRLNDKDPLIALVEEVYKPFGGQLFDGFSMGQANISPTWLEKVGVITCNGFLLASSRQNNINEKLLHFETVGLTMV